MTTVADRMITEARKGPKDPNRFMGCGIGMDVKIPKKPVRSGDFSGPKDPNRFMGLGIGLDVMIKKGKVAFGLENPAEATLHARALKDAQKICEEMIVVLKGQEIQAAQLHNLKQFAHYLADRLHQDVRNVKYLNDVIGRGVDFTTRRGDQPTMQLCAESQMLAQKITNDLTEAWKLARTLASDIDAKTFDANSAMFKAKLVSAEHKFATLESSLKELSKTIATL